MNIKLLPIWYPTVIDRDLGRIPKFDVYIESPETVKSKIDRLLFDEHADCILVGLDGQLTIVEAIDTENRGYLRRDIDYHPKSELVL